MSDHGTDACCCDTKCTLCLSVLPERRWNPDNYDRKNVYTMSETCNHDCSSCSQSCESRDSKSFLENPHEKSTIRKVIGVVSGKGGVGKSMVSSLLAANFQKKGYRTAVMDADITGPSIPKAFGITGRAMGNEEGIYPALSKTGIQIMSVNLLLEN